MFSVKRRLGALWEEASSSPLTPYDTAGLDNHNLINLADLSAPNQLRMKKIYN